MNELGSEVIRWVQQTIGRDTCVIRVDVLKAKESQSTWLLHLNRGDVGRAVLKVSPLGWEAGVDTEATTLQLLQTMDIAAPRLLGVDASGDFGSLLLLETFLSSDGRVRSPLQAMRALGATAARLHSTSVPAYHPLPRIDRPVHHDPYVAERAEGRAPTTPLLRTADRLWGSLPAPTGGQSLVHGDFHHGNALWRDDSVVALIDWDTAGIGHPGIDLGWARLEATLTYSMAAADQIIRGWADVTGAEPDRLPYWDLTAALQNPADIGDRSAERDRFLAAAMNRIVAR